MQSLGDTLKSKLRPKETAPRLSKSMRHCSDQSKSFLESSSGSVRFPGSRKKPAKFCHVPVDASVEEDLVPLLIKSWGLRPPDAIISIPPARGCTRDDVFRHDHKAELIFTRGLAEAARTTGAWVMTGGLENGVAALVGRALQDTDSPTIGFCAHTNVQNNDVLVGGQSGVVHYSPLTVVRDEAATVPLSRLDALHSHFVLVDDGSADGQAGERKLRGQLERYLCEHDVSGDGVKTPMVLFVINGDVESLLWVIEALEPQSSESIHDSPSKRARRLAPSVSSVCSTRPVLVMADSGGAAEDIFNYINQEARQLPDPERRSEEYCTQAELLLPRILELGQITALNKTPPLSFFSLSEDASIGHDHLALMLQRALQNDCNDSQERVLLSVAWGEPLILRDVLEKSGEESSDDSSGRVGLQSTTRQPLPVAPLARSRTVAERSPL